MPLSSRLPDAPVIIYLHGFASSHRSTKATWFGERLRRHGLAFSCPDFNEPDFSTLTITRMLDRIAGEVERAFKGKGPGLVDEPELAPDSDARQPLAERPGLIELRGNSELTRPVDEPVPLIGKDRGQPLGEATGVPELRGDDHLPAGVQNASVLGARSYTLGSLQETAHVLNLVG